MRTIKGIVIRSTDFREKDRIIDVFTASGIIAFIVKGVRTPTAKLKNLSGVLTYGDFFYQPGRTGNVLMGGEIIESFYPCWTDPKKYAAAMICFELAEKLFSREEDTHEELIQLLKTVSKIAFDNDPIYITLWFSVKCAEKIGCDYSVLAEQDPDEYQLLSAVSEGTEEGIVGATEIDLFLALKTLFECLKTELGASFRSLREAEKLFYKL